MRGTRWLRGWAASAGLAALAAAPVQAAPAARASERDAAILEEAFSHDLCTRNDRDLRRLNRALGRKPVTGAR